MNEEVDGVNYKELKKFDSGASDTLVYRGLGPETDKQALVISIFKWNYLRKSSANGKLVYDNGVATCGLCMFYDCEDCPVQKRGFPNCEESPYYTYRIACIAGDAEMAAKSSQAEFDFLAAIYYDDYGAGFPLEWLEDE